jgi:hypothetical protein
MRQQSTDPVDRVVDLLVERLMKRVPKRLAAGLLKGYAIAVRAFQINPMGAGAALGSNTTLAGRGAWRHCAPRLPWLAPRSDFPVDP